MKKSLLIIGVVLSLALFACGKNNKDSLESKTNSSITTDKEGEVTEDVFNCVFETNYFSKTTNNMAFDITLESESGTNHGLFEFDNGEIHLDNSGTNQYVEITDDGVFLYKIKNNEWFKEPYYNPELLNNTLIYLYPYKYSDFTFDETNETYNLSSYEYRYNEGYIRYIVSNISLKFIDDKLLSYEFDFYLAPLNVDLPSNAIDTVHAIANISYEEITVDLPKDYKENLPFFDKVYLCTSLTSDHSDNESLNDIYINSYIQLFDDYTFEYIIDDDPIYTKAMIGTYEIDGESAVMTIDKRFDGPMKYDMGSSIVVLYKVGSGYELILNIDGYDVCLFFFTILQPLVRHEFPNEGADVDPGLISENDWNNIINNGGLLHYSNNYSCKTKKTNIGLGIVSGQSALYFDKGNIKYSVPKGFNTNVTTDEYYSLKEYSIPFSSYVHYTYNESINEWENEELSINYKEFYLSNLGIIIDLSFDELTYDEYHHVYRCAYKKLFPYEDDPTRSRIYEDIEYFFYNGNLMSVTFNVKSYVYSFDYFDYGVTSVTLPK